LKNIQEIKLDLTKNQRKLLYLFLTHNQDNLTKINIDNFEMLKENTLIQLSYVGNEIFLNFEDIDIAKYREITKNIINDFFLIIEEKINGFMVYSFIHDLTLDLQGSIVKVSIDEVTKSLIPENTYLLYDIKKYNNLRNFLTYNYDDKLMPVKNNERIFTINTLIEHYKILLKNFLHCIINNVIIFNLQKESIDPYVDNFDLLDFKEGYIILDYFNNNLGESYLNKILSLSIPELLTLYNIPSHKEILKNTIANKNKQCAKLNNLKIGIYRLLFELKKQNKSFNIILINNVFNSNDKDFFELVFKEIEYLFLHKLYISFIVEKKTNIEHLYTYSGFTYFYLRGITPIVSVDFFCIKNNKKIGSKQVIKPFPLLSKLNSIFT